MLVRINKRGRGGAKGPVDYLLGVNRDRHLARVVRGDVRLTSMLIDSLKFAQRYTSGCLSFLESNLASQVKKEIMDEFERMVFPGMNKQQYELTWIEHRDKGRLELNFLIANVELTSGKRLQPYFHRSDCQRFDAFQRYINAKFALADPTDPARAQKVLHVRDLPKSRKEVVRRVTEHLAKKISEGEILTRNGVVRYLKSRKFEVARVSTKSITIVDPRSGMRVRLKGEIYESGYDARLCESKKSSNSKRFHETRLSRQESAYAELRSLNKLKAKSYKVKYTTTPKDLYISKQYRESDYDRTVQRYITGIKKRIRAATKMLADFRRAIEGYGSQISSRKRTAVFTKKSPNRDGRGIGKGGFVTRLTNKLS